MRRRSIGLSASGWLVQIISGKPLFPGRNVVHQLELITDMLGTPTAEQLAKVGLSFLESWFKTCHGKSYWTRCTSPICSVGCFRRCPHAQLPARPLMRRGVKLSPIVKTTASGDAPV